MRQAPPMCSPKLEKSGPPGRAATRERGFILIVVVGMLAVLVVLGMSYAEQGRVELRGASNTRDLAALDGLSESGFQLALRALHDDQNVKRTGYNPPHMIQMGGFGWSSRWGYNPDPTLNGAMPAADDKAPSRASASNFQDSWRMLFWNEETVEPVATWTGTAWGYGFKFRPGTDEEARRSMETQRFPQPSSVLLDTVQLQPFARSRKFRIRVGSSFGLIQVGITPKDGGINLNDVYAPGTVDESPGIYETLPSGVAPNTRAWQEGTKDLPGYDVTTDATTMGKVTYASPDRRTLEYILGRAPQFAAKNRETSVYYRYRATSLRLMLAGSAAVDNGLFNWRYAFEPYGGFRATTHAGGPAALWKYDYTGSGGYKLRASTAVMTSATSGAPTTIWNMADQEPNRFGMESSRHVMWAAMKGMAFTADGWYQKPGIGFLVAPGHYGSDDTVSYLWYPTGMWTSDPRLPSANAQMVDGYKKEGDNMFHGFGFDRFNAPRAGIDSTTSSAYWNGFYFGPGGYGHPKARTFQLHYINAVANGRFWTDLLAAWYFGGAPGYTNFLGATQSSGYNNWAHLGSSYDSIAIGTHWMPPTSHVWMPGFFNKGRISTPTAYTSQGGGGITTKAGKDELSRGMTRWPGNMPPARMAASYIVPMARWPADFVGQSNAQFSFNNFRLSIRAHGLQENWGNPDNPGFVNGTVEKNRWYDALDINNSNFPVVYGLLTGEKLPSLLARTMVAPHLHWKARMLDAEVRLRRPVKINGSAEPYNDVTNSWIPVALGLRTTDTGKMYPGGDWDGDPESASYNPWIPLRMKLNDPSKPWHPTDNIWIEPKLRDKAKVFDPVSNPFYNSAAFVNELATDANVRNDYIKYPWMPSLKKPVEINGATGTPTIDPGTNEAIIRYGLYKFDDATLIAQADWSTWIQDTGLPENFPYMPIDSYGATPTWNGPGPFDGGGLPYPSPGWDGYCFEPRWYTGRTINPLYLREKLILPANGGNADKPSIAEVAAFFTMPGQNNGALTSTLHSDAIKSPPNAWDFTAHKNFSGGLGALTYHRHIDPAVGRRNVIWGKMDFLTPEPREYYDLNGDVVGYGTGRPQDDVFLDTHLDLSLQEVALSDTDQTYASAMARPDSFRNYSEWFSQRKRAISADDAGVDRTLAPYRPMTNDVNGTLYWRNQDPNWGWGSDLVKDGKIFENTDGSGTNQFDTEISSLPNQQRTRKVRGTTQNRGYWWDWGGSPEPDVKPHSVHGLPNPDYLCLYPGGPASQHWVDQFRRYFPLQLEEINNAGDPYDDPDNNPSTMNNNPFPGAMPYRFKMVDDPDLAGNAVTHTAVNPAIPVPRNIAGDDTTPHVPAISKDDGWRLTRGGPRYNEIIANEIMDYQLNPWWPNPCVPVSEVCVPLDKVTYPSEPRAKVKVETLTGRNSWRSYVEHMTGNEGTIGSRVPKFYAYFNRFWTRANHKAVRNWAGDPNAASRPLGEPYRAITIKGNAAAGIPDELINADEGKGMFPPTWQYFGQYPPKEPTFQDRVKDFPYNAMEDQLGDDWRYLAKAAAIMTEPQMQKATGRNHPFRNWADFVAFLGHLVYRAPLDPKATPELAAANPKATRDVVDGVDAYVVCHSLDHADPRNRLNFFDGSKMRDPSGIPVYADSLRSPIVAKDGWWPIAANYGRAPDASGDAYYPNPPVSGGWNITEWKRRWDEIRGRDEAGLRVEQHYISEKAANDVLVSFSNGRIGPIDFDGDGHVTMTRGYGKDITPGYPYGTTPGNVNEMGNAKPSGDLVQQRTWDGHSGSHHWPQWALPYGYPWHTVTGVPPDGENNFRVEFEEYDDEPNYNTAFANRDFWDTDANAKTMSPLNMKIGIVPQASIDLWRKADKRDLILNCVTLPIKFHSNTFRISVVVELTDAKYEEVYASRRYQKVVSRVPDTSVYNVHGPFTGEFIEHSSRAMNGVDPELNWLGVK